MAADMAMMSKVTWQSHVMWQVTSAAHLTSGWAQFRVGHQIGPNFNPFIRIVITALYTKTVRPFTTASNQIQYHMIYIEKHLKIYMQVTFILHQKQH
jgi:hypothetical protein